MKFIFAFTTLPLFFLLSCTQEKPLNGAGATFPYPVYSAWAHAYNKESKVRINYQSIGSGGGIQQISERTVDFGATDKPLTPKELDKDRLLQFPAVIGGVVIVYNIESFKDRPLSLDPETLSKIFLGTIKKWNDPKIVSLNPDAKLPDATITVVRRSDGSGTTAIFTDYLSKVSAEWKDKVGMGTSVSWPTGIGGKGNEGVASYVEKTAHSIGYAEFAYAHQNKMSVATLKNAAGLFVQPNMESFSDAANSGDFDAKNHFYTLLNNAPGAKAWPIAGATYILLARENKEMNKKITQFFDWAFKNGNERAQELTYVPLPDSLKDKVRAYWKQNGVE